jgi:hypothetical protein
MGKTKSQKKRARAARKAIVSGGNKIKTVVVPLPKRAKRRRNRQRGPRATGMIGVASRARNMMRPMATKTARDGHMCRFRGTDFLTSISIGGTAAAAGDVLYTTVVNPKTLGVSRLATVSALWERYKFRSLKFRYEPVAPTTTAGQLLGYVDYDTYDDPTGVAGVQNLQRAAAHYGESPVELWSRTFWEIKDVDPLTDLYVDSDGTDPRWTNQGRLVVLAASAIASSTACGNIYLDYDVEFFIPQLELTPNTGYADKFTGSTSCTTDAIMGTTVAGATWNNLPLVAAVSGNSFTLPPGAYFINLGITGGTISGLAMTSSGTTVSAMPNNITAAATAALANIHCYSDSNQVITMFATATSIATGTLWITLLPRNALTISRQRLNQISRMLSLCGEVEELRKTCVKLSEGDSKESVECKSSVSSSSCSSSSATSVSMGSLGRSKTLDVEEDYVRVPKRTVKP